MENLGFVIDDDYQEEDYKVLIGNEGKELLSSQSVMMIKGEAGSGKSRLIMNFIVGLLGGDDQLGFEYDHCPEDQLIIYVSTEMSRNHLARRRRKILQCIPEDKKKNLLFLDIMGYPKRDELLFKIIEAKKPYILIIDQLADLVSSINDIEAVNTFLDSLYSTINLHGSSVICVVHQNEDSGIHTKARGHLGSTLEQKVVCSLAIAEGKNGYRIKSTKLREGSKLQEICAAFNEDTEMLRKIDFQHEITKESLSLFEKLILPNGKKHVNTQIGKIIGSENYDTQNIRLQKLIESGLVYVVKKGQSNMIYKVEQNTSSNGTLS